MMKFMFCMMSVGVLTTGCATERLHVHVEDERGCPVPDVEVGLSTMNKYVFMGSDKAKDYDIYTAMTDTNGNAVVNFRCINGSFGWGINSSNYYPSVSHRGAFKGEDLLPIPMYRLDEHEKYESVRIWRKRNPQPMIAWCEKEKRRTPKGVGRFGFDLKLFDWLPPFGHGEVADFYYVQIKESDYSEGDLVGKLEFKENDGAYVKKMSEFKEFPTTYGVDLATSFKSEFNSYGYKKLQYLLRTNIVSKDEYMIVRSRVKVDERGNIVSVHYTKIFGPFSVGCNYIVASEVVFNPNENDTNLEYDVNRNLNSACDNKNLLP